MFLKVLKSIDAKQLFGLLRLFLQKPKFAFPTIAATIECMKIAEREFGKSHHLHNKANAFRHALWNILIAKNCLSWDKNLESVLEWAEKTTTWHEHFSPNKPLEKAMDLHNNAMGRKFFPNLKNTSEEKIVEFLKEKSEGAKKILKIEEIGTFENALVYIEE